MSALEDRRESERWEFLKQVSAVMDIAPEWREWFARQLELLDLEYDDGISTTVLR